MACIFLASFFANDPKLSAQLVNGSKARNPHKAYQYLLL